MRAIIFSMLFSLLLVSCKNQNKGDIENISTNRYENDWKMFQAAVVEKNDFDWNTFIEIEGQMGEDFVYLFETNEALEKIKNTSYSELYDTTLYKQPVKQLTIGVFEEFGNPEGQVFYFEETDYGLRLISFHFL
jgi:hypothetical protein